MRNLVLILALVAADAAAQTRTYVDADGTAYRYSVNADGGVLHPVGRGATLYLGRSCDALSSVHGAGTWGWANGGFAVTVPGHRFSFRMQELLPNPGPDCWL